MLKKAIDLTTFGPSKGLNTNHDILGIDKEQSPNIMNVLIDFDGSASKRFGSNTQNSLIIANSATSGFSPNVSNLTNGLISYWPLDEANGTRYDVIGSNNLGDFNSTGQSGGIKNQAANFVAVNSNYLLINNNPSLATGDINFSLSTWIYLNSTSTTLERSVLSKRDLSSSSSPALLLHMEGPNGGISFVDSGLVPKTVTPSGNAHIDTAQFQFGTSSANFDGADDFLTVSSSADFNFGTADFTIDFWVRFNNSPSGLDEYFIDRGNAGTSGAAFSIFRNNGGNLIVRLLGVNIIAEAWSPSTATWYHIAVTRSGTSLRLFINGVQLGSTASDSSNISTADNLQIGHGFPAGTGVDGWMDEVRILKGTAAWTSNFTPPTSAYSNPQTASNIEYYLYVNTDNIATFGVSSSGIAVNGLVRATSFGALTTSTWYNLVAWHDTADFIGISVNLHVNSAAYASGVRSGSSPFVLASISNGASAFFDGRIDETSFYKSVLTSSNRTEIYNSGSGNTFQTSFGPEPWASTDFGASGIRWLTVSAGTGVYASSNLGVSFVTIATSRTATYQSLNRSKNILVETSDAYDVPLYWAGSVNTFSAVLNNSAPLARYSINFNGFLILLNSNLRKRGFFYEDENTQLTGAWSSNFDIPSTQDDETTTAFILRRYLYVSTKYYLYRVNYIGGNPDFSYIPIKDWGFVPRTVKPIYIDGIGQVVMGMSWDQKMRLFDGSDDKIISGPVEEDNEQCDFAMQKVSNSGSGLVISFAETDYNDNVYKLCVAIGGDSTQTTHFINFDGRSQAFYPYSKMLFNTMTMAQSGGIQYLMAFDRSGYCHMMDSGNLDGNTSPIDDILDSSVKFDKTPSQSQKGYRTDMFFSNETCGTIHYLDRIDFDNDWKLRETFIISGSDRKYQIHKSIDIPETYNVYQYRITSSMGTMSPWRLNRDDHFNKSLGIGRNQ